MSKPKRQRVLTETRHGDGSITVRLADQVEALEWMFNTSSPRPGLLLAEIPAEAEPIEVVRLAIRGQRSLQGKAAGLAPRPKNKLKQSALLERFNQLRKRNPAIGEEKAAELLEVTKKQIRAALGKTY